MIPTITQKTKGKTKKGQKMCSLQEQKKGESKLVPLVVGSYLTHSPSNIASHMQVESPRVLALRTMKSHTKILE
jgi:hypothetical protein